MDSLILVAALVGMIVLGAPIAVAMIVLPAGYILVTGAVPLLTVPYQMYEAIEKVPLIAVPFFMLTGELMNSGRITDRILDLSRAVVGRARGGLAQVNVVASMLFAGMNGSAVADTATIGSILIPGMRKAGYPADFSAALTAATSTIGGILPPSIAMIILASAGTMSVGALFAGGILPGALIGLAMMGLTYVISVRRNYERSDEPFTFARLARTAWAAGGALVIPLVLVGGIVGGVFSSVEAGAITAVTALAVGLVVYRSLDLGSLGRACARTVRLSASVFIIIAATGPFSWLLTRIGTIGMVEDWLAGLAGSPALFVLALLGLILMVGMVMDASANIIVLGPVLIEAATQAGFAPIQAALVVVVGFLMGTVTPPVGICYFTAAQIAGVGLERVALALVPFLLVEIGVLVLMLLVPPLTLWLPTLFGYL